MTAFPISTRCARLNILTLPVGMHATFVDGIVLTVRNKGDPQRGF
jgi:hypothetical protein